MLGDWTGVAGADGDNFLVEVTAAEQIEARVVHTLMM
jgi:hypothetical protein